MTMTLKLLGFIAATLLSSVLAAPAVVWKKNDRQQQVVSSQNDRFLHSSEAVTASDLMGDVLLTSEAPQASVSASSLSSLSAVVFLVGKGDDGSEQLTELASSGKLPLTSEKYDNASAVHHYVSGLESTSSVARDSAKKGNKVARVTLSELNTKLLTFGAPTELEIDTAGGMASPLSPNTKTAQKRDREISRADVLIVDVNAKRDAELLDSSIVNTIDSPYVQSVVLAGIRSVDEVKHERHLASKRRMNAMEQEGNKILDNRRRRLEQEEQGGDNVDDDAANKNGNNNGDDMSGVYYVYMTPNIFAGLLFGLLFIVITSIGVSCMGAVQGLDTFTDKMPSIGREA